MKQKGFAAVVIVILVAIIGIVAAYYFGILKKTEDQTQPTSTLVPTEEQSPLPTNKASVKPTPSTSARIDEIKYTLPSTWEASLGVKSLSLSPKTGGGNLVIEAYRYSSGDVKKYYCEVVGYCIKETYFESMKIGNISGYKASALDNSGGGADYFAVKGERIYIINSYNPPSPNEFEKTYKEVLNSLVF